jgi:hypothetical protein
VTQGQPPNDSDLRDQALRRLKKKRDFRGHVMAYVLVNALLIGIWAVTGAGFFWPVFALLGWGIGLGMNAWDAYGRRPITEDDIRREEERLRRSS